jgi:lipoate-protein ligase A
VRAWRLLRGGAADGRWNMGVDEALLESAARGGPPTLRLYSWERPWLSIGYAQLLAPTARRRCADAGVGIVRRVTGGGAVLHGADLTYAVAAPAGAVPREGSTAYALVSRGLIQGLRRLGIEAECAPDPPSQRRRAGFDCFATAAPHEVQSGGRKLCGSAQRRTRHGILQHGSLRLRPDPPRASRAVGLAPGSGTSLAELGWSLDPETVVEALIAGLGEALGARFQPGSLTPAELRHASRRQGANLRGYPSSVQPQGLL